jgi:hypothetical protein
VILSLVLSDITPTRQLIAERLQLANASSVQKSCRLLQEAGWIGDDWRPIEGLGKLVTDLAQAARSGRWRDKKVTEVVERARALVAGE